MEIMKQIELMKIADIVFDNKICVSDIISRIADDFTADDFDGGIPYTVENAERVLSSVIKSYTFSLLKIDDTNKLSDMLKHIRHSIKTICEQVFAGMFTNVVVVFNGRNCNLITTVEYAAKVKDTTIKGSVVAII